MKLACCGDNCKACLRYTATQSGYENELERVLEIWKNAGWSNAEATAEDMKCCGCSTANPCHYNIAVCASEHAVDNCGLCGDYPCPKIEETFERTRFYADKCRGLFSEDVYTALENAFFFKKYNLEKKGT